MSGQPLLQPLFSGFLWQRAAGYYSNFEVLKCYMGVRSDVPQLHCVLFSASLLADVHM